MNLLLFKAADLLSPTRLCVDDQRLQHLLQVHRATVGDTVRVGEIHGEMGFGTIIELGPERAIIDFSLDCPAPDKLPVTLIVALPRPKMLRRILRSVAEFGVAELYLINSYRVEKSYWQSPVLSGDSIEECLLQGLAQSRDTMLPTVHLEKRFKPFVEDRLPALLEGRLGLVAHPSEHAPLPKAESRQPTVLAIGPEGGFIPYEVEHFRAAGMQQVTLGPRILRVENAISAILGRLLATQ
ncbi:16S rRNA (uracil(1498)-N(3))-methyltransferase [Parahaliea sp. F7430]|uniref:Ribosomal RNA small subunit methyltransferase E n=1 Tax=Sediminihaliea albiluteola TaxID=2758564 RepID=A0A7W2TVT7_9GAMM|nr:16S rRNA (uracil(1498)-N(3))-methyltransferase [Sediminihaliea albiluteola]MBA6412887.1 16S rRNA (uracil(1498)-N(3))-methyltransferase [Sediminihaliea albiluteola]